MSADNPFKHGASSLLLLLDFGLSRAPVVSYHISVGLRLGADGQKASKTQRMGPTACACVQRARRSLVAPSRATGLHASATFASAGPDTRMLPNHLDSTVPLAFAIASSSCGGLSTCQLPAMLVANPPTRA